MPAANLKLNQLWRMLRELSRGYSDLRGRTVAFAPQPLGTNIDPHGLGGYYCDLRSKAEHWGERLPADAYGEDPPWVTPVAQTALGYWNLGLEGQDVQSPFLRLADWLLDNAEECAGGIVWRAQFAMPKYDLKPGWITAMGQGQAISVLLRAHKLTTREEYLKAARTAFPPMCVTVADGGTQNVIDGVPVLEEYPTTTPSAVLNGWIFALFGLHELAVVTGNNNVRELFDQSLTGLIELLPRYDIGWWTLYSLYDHGQPDVAKPFYQRLHPVLLEALNLVKPDPRLRRYAERWKDQYTQPGLLRASVNKVAFRVRRQIRSEPESD
jgi:heparosan-N-sulfate-glucuronate 5-epimerase